MKLDAHRFLGRHPRRFLRSVWNFWRKAPSLFGRSRSFWRRSPQARWIFWGGLLVLVSVFWWSWGHFFQAYSKNIPASGGTYTEALVGKIYNTNPYSIKGTALDQDIQQLIFAGLLKYNPVEQKIEDGLATLKIDESGLVYELRLKDAARFSNGESVRLRDVLFTYEEIIKNPGFRNKTLNASFEYIEIQVIDDQTLAFVLPEKNTYFAPLLTLPILPQRSFENALIEEISDPDFPFNKKPIGAGPFVLKNIVPGESGEIRIFFEPNPYFYAGKPLLEQLVLYVYPNRKTLEINHRWPTVFSQGDPFLDPEFKASLFEEYQDFAFLLPRFMGVFFNLDRPVVSELYFRKAVQKATDTSRLLDKNWIRVSSPFFFDDLAGNIPEPNAVEARNLLRDYGFPYDASLEIRTQDKGGDPVRLKFVTSTAPPLYSQIAQSLARSWESELDIEIELEVLETDELRKALEERDYDLLLFGQNFSENFDLLSPWHSSQSGKLNLSNLTRDDTDLLIEEVRFSGSRADKVELLEKLEYLVPSIIIGTPTYGFLVDKDLYGFTETFGKIRRKADRFFGVETWYFFQEKTWNIPPGKSKFWLYVQWVFGQDPENQRIKEISPLPFETPPPETEDLEFHQSLSNPE
jgi:peptide/nickel transport system substrate-binding protein